MGSEGSAREMGTSFATDTILIGEEAAVGADTDTLPFVVEYTAKASGVVVRLSSIRTPFILSRQVGIELAHVCTLKICTPVMY